MGTSRFVAVAALLALLAGSCGGDDSASEPTSTTTEAPSSTSSVPLTASFRGVTSEVIKVGVLSFDWDALAEVGVRFGVSTSEDIALAALEAINDRGGVHGRMLELYPVTFLPVGSDFSDAACVELTEDVKVFVVVGSTLGESILCYIDLHETAAVMAATMVEDRLEKAKAPYVTTSGSIEARMDFFVAEMERLGLLDDAVVGVTGSLDVSETNYLEAVRAFRDAGHPVVEGLLGANEDDFTETARQQEVLYERMNEGGVNTTVATTGVPLAMLNAVNAGYETDQWLLTSIMTGRALRDAGVDPMYIDGAYSVVASPSGTSFYTESFEDPLIKECVDDIEARTGRTIPTDLETEINDFGSVISSCAIADILEQGLLNAGPNLTNETFQAGLEAIGEIDLPGRTDSRIEPGHMGASDGLTVVRFDGANAVWVPVEE